MPANISLKPEPTWPWPICLAPCSTRLVASSTFVLSAAPAGPKDSATTARHASEIDDQRGLRIMTHLLQWRWLTLHRTTAKHNAFTVTAAADRHRLFDDRVIR